MGLVFFGLSETAHAQSTTNTVWTFIEDRAGIKTVWKLVLSLVDIIVVGGLLVASFSNIFRINIKSYEIKQILPGLIVGIILANLSFFIMRLFFELASVFAQSIGNVVAPYLQPAVVIGNEPVGSFLLVHIREELFKSMFENILGVFGSSTAGGISLAAGTGAVAAGALLIPGAQTIAIGTGVILVLLLALFWLAPWVLYLILIFLFYIRNYILVILFMTSPLAFFALGFPPLKAQWTKWWGFLWKWLTMPIASFVILALALLFLNRVNAGAGFASRGFSDYFFVNGVALFLIYFATRIPFMWGQFYGWNATQDWAKLGSKVASQTHKFAKGQTDRAIEKGVRNRAGGPTVHDSSSHRGLHNLHTRARALNVDLRPGESTESFKARVNEAERAEHEKNTTKKVANYQNRLNLFRAPEGIVEGWKARTAGWKGMEEYQIKQSDYYKMAAGPRGTAKDIFEKAREQATAIDDYAGLGSEITELHGKMADKMKLAGYDDTIANEMAAKEIRKLQNMQFGPREGAIADSPWLKDLVKSGKKKDIQEGLENARKWASLANRDSDTKSKYMAKNGGEALENLLAGKVRAGDTPGTPITPYGSVPDFEGGSGGGGSGSSDDPINVRIAGIGKDIRNALKVDVGKRINAAGMGSLSTADREEVTNSPTSHLDTATEAFQTAEDELMGHLSQSTNDQALAQRITDTVFRNIHAGNMGISQSAFEGMTREQFEAALPMVKNYANSIKSVNQISDIVSESDGIGIQGKNAEVVTKLRLDSGSLEQDMQEAVQSIERLQNDMTLPSDQLREIEVTFAKIKPGLKLDKEQAPEILRQQLLDASRDIGGIINILNNEEVRRAHTGYAADSNKLPELQRTIKIATRAEELKKDAVIQVAKEADEKLKVLIKEQGDPKSLASDATLVRNAALKLENVVDYHPSWKQAYAQLDRGEATAKLQGIAQQLVQQIMQGKPDDQRVLSHALDNNVALRSWLHSALQEGFANILPPTQPTGSAPTVPPTKPS